MFILYRPRCVQETYQYLILTTQEKTLKTARQQCLIVTLDFFRVLNRRKSRGFQSDVRVAFVVLHYLKRTLHHLQRKKVALFLDQNVVRQYSLFPRLLFQFADEYFRKYGFQKTFLFASLGHPQILPNEIGHNLRVRGKTIERTLLYLNLAALNSLFSESELFAEGFLIFNAREVNTLRRFFFRFLNRSRIFSCA